MNLSAYRPELLADLEIYRISKSRLRKFVREHLPSGTFVEVDDKRYKGFGVVSLFSHECPPDMICIRLENGNEWHYPLRSIIQTVPPEKVSERLREMASKFPGRNTKS